jgi:NADH-quinone oxidoreductase subunit B
MQWRDWYGDGSLYVTDVALACCALECEAASPVAGQMITEPPVDARLAVIISGTVTDRLAPAVVAMVDAAGAASSRRPTVISLGACASSGGPYWDSYAVTKGVDQLLEVDIYVPGCPPPPEALRAVLDQLTGRVAS